MFARLKFHLLGVSALFVTLFSCMRILNIQIPDGVYVVGDWNGWVPRPADAMTLEGDVYKLTIPSASLTYFESSAGAPFQVSKYKVIAKLGGGTIVSSDIFVWRDKITDAGLTVYASPSVMVDGRAVGVGDSEKEVGDWFIAGNFNNWTLERMTYDGTSKVFRFERVVNLTDRNVYYKIARRPDWKPYELQFDGRIYNAGYGVNAHFTAPRTGMVRLVFKYDPKLSILTCETE